jgi:hypothetical protein
MQMPGRKYSNGGSYRYGFNGQENSDEISAGLTTAMYWEYDSRIGRRWNVDPVLKVWESPYLCFSANPILMSDPDGDVASVGGGGGDDPPKKKLPWYLRANKHGGKPVLTLGAKNLVTAPITSYTSNPLTNVGVFGCNVLAKAWNGIANTWNNALDGQTGTDQLRETVQILEKKTVNDLKKVGTYEDIAALALTVYAFKKISTVEAAPSAFSDAIKFTRSKSMTFADFQGKSLGYYEYTKANGLELDLNIPSQLQGKGLGTKIFSDALMSTGAKKFTATWIKSENYATGSSINLQRYESALTNSTAQQAAWKTWSGQQAAANGFKNVSVRNLSNGVEAVFTK